MWLPGPCGQEFPRAGQPAVCMSVSPGAMLPAPSWARSELQARPHCAQNKSRRHRWRPPTPGGSQLWDGALRGSHGLGDVGPSGDGTMQGSGLGWNGPTPSFLQ